jgi:hypothetical protein
MKKGQPVQAKLAHPMAMMAGSGVKPAQKEKITLCIKLPCIDRELT